MNLLAKKRDIIPGLAFLCLFLLSNPLFAGPPAYKEVHTSLKKIWKKKYPITPLKIIPNPRKKGALRVRFKGKTVYYYQFNVRLPRPYRNEKDKIVHKKSRLIELWVRYRSWEKTAYDLTFTREDRLPGTSRRWLKNVK